MTTYFASPLMRSLRERLVRLYGEARVALCMERLAMIAGRYGVGALSATKQEKWTQRDAVLITYGDMIRADGGLPLRTLKRFLDSRFAGVFSTVHLLPFFPYSSDDGFSVIHYRHVNPELGTWGDVEALGERFSLMFDLVLNHVSSLSGWFVDYQTGVAPGRDYFIEVDPAVDLSAVVRPRTLPLLTPTPTREGERHVWTTFSADQIDLNHANPDVLFEILDILLFYLSKGMRFVRLDAVAYLWKRIGTPCIHLPETHEIVKLMRDFLKITCPDALLVTETNVPHEENISYFGDGNEAHIVYQFALPPLILDAMVSGTATALTAWAAALTPPPSGCTYLNFTASHDGIGVRPLQGLVSRERLDALVEHVRARGGAVSTKRNTDGSESPYELNITWYDVMGMSPDEPPQRHFARFLCSQMIPLALQGIPAVYFHALTATPNNPDEVRRTGASRSINRGRWQLTELDAAYNDKDSNAGATMREYQRVLKCRADHSAFHPDAPQRILDFDQAVFAVQRESLDGKETILAISNVSAAEVIIPRETLPEPWRDASSAVDCLRPDGRVHLRRGLTLDPYQTVWLSKG